MSDLIVFCGIDGSGKSTQIHLLSEYLQQQSIDFIALKQPTAFYQENHLVRKKIDKSEEVSTVFLSLLSATDRIKQCIDDIEPALRSGKIVLLDRYVYSAYAYMLARGGVNYPWLKEINKFYIKPKLVFYLDIAPQEALQRIVKRDGRSQKREEQNLCVMNQVRENFLSMAAEHHFITLDATQSACDIHECVMRQISLMGIPYSSK